MDDIGIYAPCNCERRLRSYQLEAGRTIFDSVTRNFGGRFTVMFPRQSGKNELQALLEHLLMVTHIRRGGEIVKVAPTYKPQGLNAYRRLMEFSEKDCLSSVFLGKQEKRITYGNSSIKFLSGSPNAQIVGATASLLLEVDEAQNIRGEKFDHDLAPMAASTNAVTLFWGTAWDDTTLLARELREGLRLDQLQKSKTVFSVNAVTVGEEVPAYKAYVSNQIARLGRDHTIVRTQYFCEEITDRMGMFTEERLAPIWGTHPPQFAPQADGLYVFLLDVAGSDELTGKEKKAQGFSDLRDSTVLTICQVTEGEDGPLWLAVARRSYRNVPSRMLREKISEEIEHWNPARIVIDHTGLGAGLSEDLAGRYPGRVTPVDITATVKSRMAWELFRHFPAGHWKEYKVSDQSAWLRGSDFVPETDPYEIISDPAVLQTDFLRQLRACRMEPSAEGSGRVRWGVPSAARDHGTGRFIHDDLVLSMALFTLIYDEVNWADPNILPYAAPFDMDYRDPWENVYN